MSQADSSPPGGVHRERNHDSAILHVTGEARYVDDLPTPTGTLHAAVGLSEQAHARITTLDLQPVRDYPGVVAVLGVEDVLGDNDIGPVLPGDKVFAEGLVEHVGQALFVVAATDVRSARRAARTARVDYETLPAILDIDEAMAAQSFVGPPRHFRRGDPEGAIDRAPHRLQGRLTMGGQDHFYLEGQVALAIPGEGGEITIYSSTQHPAEVQHMVARVLGIADSLVTVIVRRLGGGFGGKETQAALFASQAALLAVRTGRAVKLRLDRDDDMLMTGKRHEFVVDYRVGYDDDGLIQGADIQLASRCGMSADLSLAVNDRAMFHAENAYFIPDIHIGSYRCKTHTVSNTAFRGFGGPQGMLGIETVMDEIARERSLDPLEVRRRNLYRDERCVTPYGMTIEDNILPALLDKLSADSDYPVRRQAATDFNAMSPYLKRGIALTPVKFGISFTTKHLNQAGALIHIYTDGSVQLNHGGIEMGQGLHSKVTQIVAEILCIDADHIRITATATDKVPNTSATAASSGSDLNGEAAKAAALLLRERLQCFAAEHYGVAPETVIFLPNRVRVGDKEIPFPELVKLAYLHRVQLSANGFFRTPKIDFDWQQGGGRPFLYFAYGAALSEVLVDTLTGEYRVERVSILHDAGRSLNPAIDRGQIEGGFIQGMGWLTTEELCWNSAGAITTHAPSTYKIPACSDTPPHFEVALWDGANHEDIAYRSKAVGEPPFMLAMSVFHAIKDALVAAGGSGRINAPATPEAVLMSLNPVTHLAPAVEHAAL